MKIHFFKKSSQVITVTFAISQSRLNLILSDSILFGILQFCWKNKKQKKNWIWLKWLKL